MAHQILEPEVKTPAQNTISSSEIFGIVQQLSSQINQSRLLEVVHVVKTLRTEDNQMIVDLLSMALEKYYHLLMNPDRLLNLLLQIASMSNIVARNRTLNPECFTSEAEESPGVYIVRGEPPLHVRVIKQGKKGTPRVFSKTLITWAHLSHPNIFPVFGAFLDGEGNPISLVSPWQNKKNIVDHAKTLPQIERMPLISDVTGGLCYIHQLNIVHGTLSPQSVLISNSGRALITDLDASSETSAIRYSAPEVLESENIRPTKAADVWALGCLCYEVLSGNVPFCQYRQEGRASLAVVKGKQPIRPGQGGMGEEIDDTTWHPISACWEFEPEDRPNCLKLHEAFASTNTRDDRPQPELMIRHARLGKIEALATDLKSMISLLNRVLGTGHSLQPPSQIPEHLREPLSGLADNLPKANTVAIAAKKLSPDDTQTLLDALDLVLEENSIFANCNNPVVELLTRLMASTHIYPRRYKLHRIRYNPSSIAENSFGKVYKGQDLHVCVNMVTNSSDVANVFEFLALWAHSSHPNVLPFCGVFDEYVNDILRFCIVSPYMENGTLHDYAPRLDQKSRIPLISDVICGLGYLHGLDIYLNNLRPDNILISNEGRALVASFGADHIVTCTTATNATPPSTLDMLRFQAPEWIKTGQGNYEADIWSFGCLCYELLSGKLPYHQYLEMDEVQAALCRGEPPERPRAANNDIDVIEDQSWELITGCCRLERGARLTVTEIQKLLGNLRIQDDRPDLQNLPGTAILSLRKYPNIEWDRVQQLLGQIQVELLRNPLSKLIQNRISDVATEAVKFQWNDVQTLVDFLDLTLKDYFTISDDRNRVLALLSRIMTLAQVFPQRHWLKGVKYDPQPIAEGAFGKVHRGRTDPTICVKVIRRVDDSRTSSTYIKELIFWAHSSHPNVLPFYGVFFDDSQQICLVSPYMEKGNLRDYARQLPQKSRVPLLSDTIKGLDYLHGLGVVHTDLKGENVLISGEGRGLITDFGASHIVTATAKGGSTSGSVATTLRFTAPEVIRDETRRVRPTKECDIWSFGCLCYEVLSRKLPYYEYQLDAQVFAALFREQLPKRPGLTKNGTDDDDDDGNDWDSIDEKDWDDLDNTVWSLITECLVPKPEEQPSASRIQELIIDMKAWDSRPAAKSLPGADILKQRSNIEINMNRAGVLLDHLQVLFLARRIYNHSDQDIVTAVEKLNHDDADTLTNFWALALNNHISILSARSRLLAIYSAVIASQRLFQAGYILRTRPNYHSRIIGEGSFGKVYRGSELKICVKVVKASQMDSALKAQWDKALIPWAHSSHPNILPFYGMFLRGGRSLISPFIENGNLHRYAPTLPQELRPLLISDVIEGLIYLHTLGIIHGNIKTQNVLVSDEGRGIITDFRPYHANVAAAADGPTGPYITSTLRFTAPELVKNSTMLPTTTSDVWSMGCLIYEVFSRQVPFDQYTQDSQIWFALSQGELPIRYISADSSTDEVDHQTQDLILKCCAIEPESRVALADIQKWFRDMSPEDNRPAVKPFCGAEILLQWKQYTAVDILHVGEVMDKLEVQLPRVPQMEMEDGSSRTDPLFY